jgi:hypothetical protein
MRQTWRDVTVVILAAGAAFIATRLAGPAAAPPPAPVAQAPVADPRVDALEQRVAALEQQPRVVAPAHALDPDAGALAATLLAELDAAKARAEQGRAEFRQEQAKQAADKADVELVKLQTAQDRITPEETQKNVRRRLAPLGLDNATLTEVAPPCAQYLRARVDALIELLQRVSSGQHVTRAEAEAKLEPLARDLEAQLGQLDPLTRKAVVTEVSNMARLPVLAFPRR